MKVLLVPSCEILEKDTLGPQTVARCFMAFRHAQHTECAFIIVSGGIYQPKEIQTLPAATIMKLYLNSLGVPDCSILTETKSRDIFESIAFTQALIREKKLKNVKITVVTNWQHAIRFWISFLFGYGKLVKIKTLNYKMSFKENLHESLFFFVHLFGPKSGGIWGKINRRKRKSAGG